MISSTFKIHGLDGVTKALERVEKQSRFAVAQTLTEVGRQIKSDLARGIAETLDKPTPFIRNSTFLSAATPGRLKAIVGVKDITSRGNSPAKILAPHFYSGNRPGKKLEGFLSGKGALPRSQQLVAGRGARLDRFGNVSRAELNAILSTLNQPRGKKSRIGGTFSVRPGDRRTAHLRPGIYARIGRGRLSPKLIFTGRGHYRSRINFEAIAQKALTNSGAIFRAKLAAALDSAK